MSYFKNGELVHDCYYNIENINFKMIILNDLRLYEYRENEIIKPGCESKTCFEILKNSYEPETKVGLHAYDNYMSIYELDSGECSEAYVNWVKYYFDACIVFRKKIMELYTKTNVACTTNIASYPDLLVKQVCYNSRMREVKMYRAAADVEDGYRYLRASKFSFDFHDLSAVMSKMEVLFDNEVMLIHVSVKPTKQLVFQYNEEYGNWELGFQKKTGAQKRKAFVVDLEDDDVAVCSNLRKKSDSIPQVQYEQMNSYDLIKFKKNEDFEFMIEQLMEFQREVYELFPYL